MMKTQTSIGTNEKMENIKDYNVDEKEDKKLKIKKLISNTNGK